MYEGGPSLLAQLTATSHIGIQGRINADMSGPDDRLDVLHSFAKG